MPIVTANGIAQHYATMGPIGDPDAPIAVLIHGVLIDSLASYYFTLAKPFADAGVGTLMYDLRGHGKTAKPPSGYAMSDYAQDLIALLDELDITRPAFLLGNSFGGSLALYVAARYPERVAGVVMTEAEAPTAEWGERLRNVFGESSKHLSRREVIPWIRMRYGRHLAKQAKAAIDTLNSTRIEQEMPYGSMLSMDELAALRCPVLAIYAGDWNIKAEQPLLVTWLTDCTTEIIEGQDHSVLVSIPSTVCELVLPWMTARRGAVGAGSAVTGAADDT